MSAIVLSRRTMLLALAVAAATGCDERPAPTPVPPRPDPDVALRREVAADVRKLLSSYQATLTVHPGLEGQLRPLISDHGVHLRALRTGPAVNASPRGTPFPAGTSTPAGVPRALRAAQTALARLEQDAADRRVRQLATASPALARLLAAIGASEAAHSALLSRPQ